MASGVNVADHESVEENTPDIEGGLNIEREEKLSVCSFGFDIKDQLTDLTLIVEDRCVYVNRGVLGVSSSVLRDLFETKLKGKEKNVLEIPDTNYEEFAEFLACMYPNKQHRISKSNVLTILPLAFHYKVDFLIDEAEALLMSITSRTEDQHYLIQCLESAKRFGLNTLRQHCFDRIVQKRRENIQTLDDEMHTDDKVAILDELMPHLRSEVCKIAFLSSDAEDSKVKYIGNFRNAKYKKEEFNFLGKDMHKRHECLKTEVWGINFTLTRERTLNLICFHEYYHITFTLSPDTDSFIGKEIDAAIKIVFQNNFPGKNMCLQSQARMSQGSKLVVLFRWDTLKEFGKGFRWNDKFTVVMHILVNKPELISMTKVDLDAITDTKQNN